MHELSFRVYRNHPRVRVPAFHFPTFRAALPLLPHLLKLRPRRSAHSRPRQGNTIAIWRILRCNPWSLGGVDEVPARGKWTSEAWTPPQDWAGYDDPWAQTPMGMDRTDDKTSVDTLEDFSAKAEHHADAVSVPRAS